MSASRRVVVVDSYAPTKALPDQFLKAGAELVRVQTTPETPLVYRGEFTLNDYVDNFVHDGDTARLAEKLAGYDPVAVVPAGETGVELADELSSRLGVLTNGVELSPARRDKYAMIETIRRAGLAAARQIQPASEQELVEWHRAAGGRIVVKPLRGAGGSGVHFCDTPEESAAAYRELIGAVNLLSARNTAVVAQEYLRGTEYMVNTVSRDGRHHVTDILRTTRIAANGMIDLCDGLRLVRRRGEVQDQLAEYAARVLDALGIQHGPGHLEIKITAAGPVLVEMGARICGGNLPQYVQTAIGESQLDWTVDAYLDPEKFHSRAGGDYPAGRHFAAVALISPVEGVLRGYRHMGRIEQLESFNDLRVFVRPGDRIMPTVDDMGAPALVTLMHDDEETVLRDTGTIHYLDGEGFYELAEA
ncbi:ATP-grasp domain-containing protein [Actinosynnema sp. NPDC091369]